MNRESLSLRSNLLIYVILPLIAFMSLASFLSLRALEREVEARMEQDVELIAQAIRLPLSRSLERGREGAVKQAIESAFDIDQVYGAYVYDVGGEKIASAGRSEPLPQRRHITMLAAEGDDRGEYGEVAGRNVYSYFVPLTDSGERNIGLLQVTRKVSDFRTYIAELRQLVLILLGISVVFITGLVSYGHHSAIGSYLNGLGSSMSRVRSGDRNHRATLRGPREILELEATFNTMLDSMQAAEEEVRIQIQQKNDLRETLRQAEKLAAIGELAAGVAHELGTPLSIIDGKAQQALRQKTSTEVENSHFGAIRAEVKRMENIIRQLLDFGRKHDLQPRKVEADVIAKSAVATLHQSMETRANILLKGDLPAPAFMGDPAWIERALINLLKNAVQAAPDGEVVLSWAAADGDVIFVIDDNGPGIDQKDISRIFEPFFTTKPVGDGTGLGLSLVHRLVEEHHGRITIGQSESGGARFQINLPMQQLT